MFKLGINYNNENPMYKKGTTLYRNYELQSPLQGSNEILEQVASDTEEFPTVPLKLSKTALQQEKKRKTKAGIATWHGDIMKNEFWQQRSWILSGRAGRLKLEEENGGSASLEVRPGPESLMVPNGNAVEYAAEGLAFS